MRALALLVLAVIVGAGCIGAQPQPQNNPPPGNGNTGGTGANNTTEQRPAPVARMQVFDVDGALVFESNFVAENATAGAAVLSGGEVRFLGSNSEAVDKTATITSWLWDFGDGARATGRGVSHTFPDTGGIFRVTLTVADSNGNADPLVVTLGAYATRTFNETVALQGALQLGTLGNAANEFDTVDQPLVLAANVQGFPVEVEGLQLNLTPGEQTSDFDFMLLDAEGTEVGSSAGRGPGTGEAMSFGPGELSPGTYTLRILLYAGANGTYTISGEVLYRVVNAQVEEQFGGHAH